MKKHILAFSLFFTGFFCLGGDGGGIKVGLKVSPGISSARVMDKDSKDGFSYSANGSKVSLLLGPCFDFPILKNNVYFSTGVWFSLRSAQISAKGDSAGYPSGNSNYGLQYVMLPTYFKFYTNEIVDDVRLYFNLGATFDLKISEKSSGTDGTYLMSAAHSDNKKLFAFGDASLLLGAGVEYKLGSITLFSGLSYNRGLANVVNPFFKTYGDHKLYQSLAIKNNLVNLDLGIQF